MCNWAIEHALEVELHPYRVNSGRGPKNQHFKRGSIYRPLIMRVGRPGYSMSSVIRSYDGDGIHGIGVSRKAKTRATIITPGSMANCLCARRQDGERHASGEMPKCHWTARCP